MELYVDYGVNSVLFDFYYDITKADKGCRRRLNLGVAAHTYLDGDLIDLK